MFSGKATKNLELPQWEKGDHPDFLTDMNNAYQRIDTAFGSLDSRTENLPKEVEQNTTIITSQQQDIQQLQSDVSANSIKLVNVESEAAKIPAIEEIVNALNETTDSLTKPFKASTGVSVYAINGTQMGTATVSVCGSNIAVSVNNSLSTGEYYLGSLEGVGISNIDDYYLHGPTSALVLHGSVLGLGVLLKIKIDEVNRLGFKLVKSSVNVPAFTEYAPYIFSTIIRKG